MSDPLIFLSSGCCLAWFYLLFFHHHFWRADQRLKPPTQNLDAWPEVAVVVPARDEAKVIRKTLMSLTNQDYPGSFSIILVDDNSDDGTGEVARKVKGFAPVHIVSAPPLTDGWTGKLAALRHGIAEASKQMPDHQYLFLTDADIRHPHTALRRLVTKSKIENLDLTSLMARLHCSSKWERLLIPAFIFFFQKLYPFPAVNDHKSQFAGAAGGVMLVRRKCLELVGGLETIKDAVIDDCTIAGLIKNNHGRIWLGLADDTYSIRPYRGISEIWDMVARTAFTQLNFKYLRLLVAVFGMMLIYLSGPLIFVFYFAHTGLTAALLGLLSWLLMSFAYLPTILYQRMPIFWAATLPIASLLYTCMTVDSAIRYLRNKGSGWKGRNYSF
tara:strand:- start:214 stop:1368 length:1155 start_codon:yes stop_codon:yes gene_type:complete